MNLRRHLSKRTRFEVFKRDGFRCVYCGVRPDDSELRVDHVMPVIEGGTNDPANLATACHDCNAGKGAGLIPQRVGALTIEKLVKEFAMSAEVEVSARKRRSDWIGSLCVPIECETVLRWLSEHADVIDCVSNEFPWYSPRFHEIFLGLLAVGLIGPDEADEVLTITPRGTTRLKLMIKSHWPKEDGSCEPPWALSNWWEWCQFPRVEDIH